MRYETIRHNLIIKMLKDWDIHINIILERYVTVKQ